MIHFPCFQEWFNKTDPLATKSGNIQPFYLSHNTPKQDDNY